MGVRNVGSFFSDYYLFELLGKKHTAELGADEREMYLSFLRRTFRKADASLNAGPGDLSEARSRWYRPLLDTLGHKLKPVTEPLDTTKGLVPIQYAISPSLVFRS